MSAMAYIVLSEHGEVIQYNYFSREGAVAHAEAINGVVLEVPIIADFRPQ